ncbi:MAG TPA: hypothetical protein VM536_11505 [Chloroflexia bacterium]|nr:hypothetical protein [Chloroflexia bacterium]
MSTVSAKALINSVIILLTEAYAGPPDPSTTWFIDNEANSGILGALEGVSAAEASRSVDSGGQEGSTIAANAEHLRWSLAQFNAAIRGGAHEGRWEESWHVISLGEADWDNLRRRLREEFETLCGLLKAQEALPEEFISGTLASVAHAAFHLGLIRQMIARVQQAAEPG